MLLRIASLTLPEGPARKAGLRPGDFVVGVGGVPSKAWAEMKAKEAPPAVPPPK